MTPRYFDDVTITFPAGPMDLVVASDGRSIVGIRFGRSDDQTVWLKEATRNAKDPAIAAAVGQLEDYASGVLEDFDLPIEPTGTEFQQAVWAELLKIPYGRTTTYGAIAMAIGRPHHARAVGAAVGSNPIGIVIPCHRVMGANGSLTGFGGGLDNKVSLLSREGVTAAL
jgi:methylated-DNA-[protein]-cysteine S-methyltransferase